ncbi:MAG: FMN-binding negative transcriptional regulator [Bacteroidetes bacterium]|nr:MAG: FMN-binding negative transcriptional regulator [Bacteroidota bacterium]REK03439.1 MAG: FMN-binding negative transcriptional regulator [Bacteroidota bacterium]REK34449.1 MAG: FMN-binding negative transcriptional regulator [Bacteroidota bacterium]REK50433.1 MAG: FMN-binding negative transcriptional regulator [Bacteroidota bacterium]
MFIPAYFRKEKLEEIEAFIRKNPFAILVCQHEGKPWATHIPVELAMNANGESVLSGHISRSNTSWKSFANGEDVLMIFNGPHAYVSSSWYNHVNVPTWNYMAVHVYGKMKIIEGKELYNRLDELMHRYENGSAKPVEMKNLPKEMIDNYLKGIVGFEMSMEKIQGKWKLSQNRNDEDHSNIISELEKINEINSRIVAEEMKKEGNGKG